MTTIELNPMSPEFRADPYPIYRRLRDEAPVHAHTPSFVTVARYEDVVQVLKSPQLFSSSAISFNVRGQPTRTIINADPPDHTQLRNLINRAFTPRMVADMEPRIREITRGLIDRVAETGEVDLVRDLAFPLPVTIIAELLGVPAEHRDDFKRWSDAVVSSEQGLSEDERARMEEDIEAFQAYFQRVIDERRQAPRSDLISVLVQAEEQGVTLTPDEVLVFTALLLVAGNETTTNLLSNAVLALLQHPDQLALVLSDLSLVPNLVEEALRWDSPVQFLFRTATRDTEVAGVPIAEGAIVVPIYASGNRDERRYPEPDRFDVTRNAQGHLAFGHGVHFCLGAPLARLEAKVALEQVLLRLPRLARRDDAPLERVRSPFLRGLETLPLVFEPSRVGAAAGD